MLSKKIKIIAIIASFLIISSLTFTEVKASGVTRLGGQDRYETSVNIAKQFDKLNAIIIVNGEDYHDAISSCVFAKKMGAAILLTENNTLSKASLDFLNNSVSKDKNVYIIGNTKRVSSAVESTVKNFGFSNVERISGQSDYDTNSAVLDKMNVAEGTPVIFVSGAGYADGISISSIAAAKGYPILMTDVNSISSSTAEELKKIKPSKIYFVGGNGVISQTNRDNIASIAGVSKENIVNLTGEDRYETNLNIMNQFKLQSDTVAFAYGGEDNTDGKFADALAGTAYAAAKNAPILLVNSNNNKLQKQFVDSMKYSNVLVYGGIGSISDNLLGSLISNSSSAILAYSAVLQNGAMFFSTDDSKSRSLNDFLNDNNFINNKQSITHFTVLDMDGDNIPEVILELSSTNAPEAYEILHYMNGKVYGYHRVLRALEDLKSDGTFLESGGAFDNTFAKLKFNENGSDEIQIASEVSNQENGNISETYYIGNKIVTKKEFDDFMKSNSKSKQANWYVYNNEQVSTIVK
ncbi:cell wall-binding repeat-containing protein [Clostridium sp. JS66]|uniref:cell wall-binding repeat-containing protein n=1 Tax=Clostridium sp. JS66 TaxID=3064705 RepID=UPI00298DFE09|nr:cell wall-binding repeat-containing protein [Clostridium sp. JS66]WPC39909.1 cell wall-binding repeat-containing protein [Clostridium sp. JS66]